jgi:hypothetical protein
MKINKNYQHNLCIIYKAPLVKQAKKDKTDAHPAY